MISTTVATTSISGMETSLAIVLGKKPEYDDLLFILSRKEFLSKVPSDDETLMAVLSKRTVNVTVPITWTEGDKKVVKRGRVTLCLIDGGACLAFTIRMKKQSLQTKSYPLLGSFAFLSRPDATIAG